MDTTLLTAQRVPQTLAVVVVAVAGILLTQDRPDIPRLAVAFTVSWVLCVVLLARGRAEGIYRASAAYLVLFGLFHGGLLISVALRGANGSAASDDSWFYSDFTPQAVHLVILGMAVFTIVAGLVGGPSPAEPHVREPETAERRVLTAIGLTAQLTGLVIFAVAVLRAGGLALLSGGGYLAFVEVNQSDTALALGYLFLGIGPVLAVVAGGRGRMVAWTVFVGYAVMALIVGTRGEVLFPLVALLAVEARRGRMVRSSGTILGAVGVLMVIGLVRHTRLTGSSGDTLLSLPLDAIAEMGFTLRPTIVVLNWHSWHEPFRGGETLAAVPLRLIENVTGWHGGVPGYDDRLFNVEIATRVGQIGGSPIAEGYHNFGVPGVVLFMAAVGLILALVERAPRTPRVDARIGIVLLPLLVQIRNSFAPVPFQLALGLLLLCAVYLLAARQEKHGHER